MNNVYANSPPLFRVSGHRGMGCTDSFFASSRLQAEPSRPPENTLESFAAALEIKGLAGLELDVVMTKDHEIVICHSADAGPHVDAWLQEPPRVLLCSKTLDEVKRLKVGPDKKGAIPTLSELFGLLGTVSLPPHFLLNIELKDVIGTNEKRARTTRSEPLFTRRVAQVVRETQFPLSQIRFSSFSLQVLKEMSRLLPQAEFALLTGTAEDRGMRTFPAERRSETYAMATCETIDNALTEVPGLTALHAENSTITPKVIEYCQKKGLSLGVWFWKEKLRDVKASSILDRTLTHAKVINLPLYIMTDYPRARVARVKSLLTPPV